MIRVGLRVMLAGFLVAAICPTFSYANVAEPSTKDDGFGLSRNSEIIDDVAASGQDESTVEGEDTNADEDSAEGEDVISSAGDGWRDESALLESTASAGEPVPTAASNSDCDPTAENSWRYENGVLLSHDEGASPDSSLSAMSAVVHPDGYSVYDWFDHFDRGYCSGDGAAKGIDVSKHQGVINWEEVKASGVDFAIVRCGYGMDLTKQDDEYWLTNVKGCLDNDIALGVYLYSYATNTSKASSEADHVLRLLSEAQLGPADLSLPVFLDMEDASTMGSDFAAIASTFFSKVEAAGYETGVYASQNWWQEHLVDSCFDTRCKWVAAWNTGAGLVYDGVSDFENGNGVWQFSDYGIIPGISGRTDLNYSYMESAYGRAEVEPGQRTVADGVYEVETSLADGMVLDIANGSVSDGGNVQLYESNGTPAQRFRFTYDGQGFYTVSNFKSGKLLDVADSSWADGANVQQWRANGEDAQKWRIDDNGDGTYTLVSKCSGKVLDVDNGKARNGANVQQYTSNGTAAQKWRLAGGVI